MFSVAVLTPNRCHEGRRCYYTREIYRTCLIVFMYFVVCSSTRARTPHSLHDHWRGANSDGNIMKAEDSIINKMKNQSSQKKNDYLSTVHIFTSTPKEMPMSPSEQTRKPLLRNVYTAYKARQNKVYTTTVETKTFLSNVSDFYERNSLKNRLEMNSSKNNSQLGSSVEKEFDKNSTHKNSISYADEDKQIQITKSVQKLNMSENIPKYKRLTDSFVSRQINHSLLESSTTNFKVSINSVANLSNKFVNINNRNSILSSVSSFPFIRLKNRKSKQHSLNEHDHFQKIVRNDGLLSVTNPELKITLKQSFSKLNPLIVTTIRNVLKPGKEKNVSALKNVSDKFEISKLLRTTQSESTLKNVNNQYNGRFSQNSKHSDVTVLPLTKILKEKVLERTTIVPKNIKELSESDAKQRDLNEKESRYTNKIKHKEVTKSTNDRTKRIVSDENLKRTSFLPSKTSTDLSSYLLNKDSSTPNFIFTADYQHLKSFKSNNVKQRFEGSITELDTNFKKKSSIQFNKSTPPNSDFIDEIYASHANFPSKSSQNQFFISELSTTPTIISSGKGASFGLLYEKMRTKMKKSKITRKQFTSPKIELIYQTVNPKYSSSKYLGQSTAQSKIDNKHTKFLKDIYFNDPKKLLSTHIPSDMPTKLSENVSLLLSLVPQSSTTRSENSKPKMTTDINVDTLSERSNEENKSSDTVNYIEEFTQTSISEKSEGISLKNVNENKYYPYSINPTHESYKHPSTSSTPKRLFHFTLGFNNSTRSKSIVDEKHRTSQISPAVTSDPKTSEHTILTTKYDVSTSTSKLPTYYHDALVSTIMTSSRNGTPPSHSTPTRQLPLQTTTIPTIRISPITRDISTQSISTKATQIFRQTFPTLYSKIIVEQASATTDKMSTLHPNSLINEPSSNHTSSKYNLQPLSTRNTRHFPTQRPSYLTKRILKQHTTPQITKTPSESISFLTTKSSTRNRPHLHTTLPTQHTSSLTRKLIFTPSTTISTRNTKFKTIKLSARPLSIITSKSSTPYLSSHSFTKIFLTTTILTSKTHKPNGSIQSEDTQKNNHYDSTSMTQTTEHISKDSRVPTPNTPSSNSVDPSQESASTPSQATDSTPSQTSDRSPSSKVYQRLLVVCKVDTSVNINSHQFQDNIRNGLVKSYIEGKALGEVNKSVSMKKRRKRSIEETSDQIHQINDMILAKCADDCKTNSEVVKAMIIRQVRRDTLVSIYFQMQENGVVVEAEKAAEIFARLQLTEISVHLKYAIFEKVRVIKSLLPQSQHPLKSSSTKWMMVTIAAPSIPVLCVIFILLSSWYRNHTRLRQKAMADISRGSGYTESLADVGLEIDMEKGEIVSRAGSTSVLWSEDFVASAAKETHSQADYFAADYESSRSNSWSAYADPNNVFNSLRNKTRSPIPKRYQRQGKYAKKHSASSFNFETGLEDEWLGCLLSTDYRDAGNFKAEWLQLQSFRRCSLGANEHNTTVHQFMNPLNRFWADTSGPTLQQCSPTSVAAWPKNNNGKTIHPRVKHAVKLPVGPKC